MNPNLSPLDRLIVNADQAVRTLFGRPATTDRENPSAQTPENELDESERDLSIRLMRVNHTGEVCAQALYQGQALTAKLPRVRVGMEQAAAEENDHLDWCQRRIQELGGRTSALNPVWYAGSFALGALAGYAGDRWSLGFVAETERQVVKHLDDHLQRLAPNDEKSRTLVEQMRKDEGRHATQALEAGGAALPGPVQALMRAASKVMTRTTYWI